MAPTGRDPCRSRDRGWPREVGPGRRRGSRFAEVGALGVGGSDGACSMTASDRSPPSSARRSRGQVGRLAIREYPGSLEPGTPSWGGPMRRTIVRTAAIGSLLLALGAAAPAAPASAGGGFGIPGPPLLPGQCAFAQLPDGRYLVAARAPGANEQASPNANPNSGPNFSAGLNPNDNSRGIITHVQATKPNPELGCQDRGTATSP